MIPAIYYLFSYIVKINFKMLSSLLVENWIGRYMYGTFMLSQNISEGLVCARKAQPFIALLSTAV